MAKRVLPLLLVMLLATASGARATRVDGVTGATPTKSAVSRQKADERRMKKALTKLTGSFTSVEGTRLEAAVAVKGKIVARTSRWEGTAVPAAGMQEERTMNFRTTLKGQDNLLAYKFLRQESGKVCAVSIPQLEACVYLSRMPDVAQKVASAVHRYVAPVLEDILGSREEEE